MRPAGSPTLIKRYAGRRLYDTVRAIYLTDHDLVEMVLSRQRFIVRDAESGEDVTRSVLHRLR